MKIFCDVKNCAWNVKKKGENVCGLKSILINEDGQCYECDMEEVENDR